jgi:hypothetical protein
MATLAEIRARLQKQETKLNSKTNNFESGPTYPHWNIEEGQTARLRFLPDANPKNDYFWVEKAMIKLEFAGIKGDSASKPVLVQVPCIEMYPGFENKCPILAEVRQWYKIPGMEEQASKYWKKRTYIFQGFVRENPMKEENAPESPIRRFLMSNQIFSLVKSALMDPELENLPTDYQNGIDFNVIKTTKGKYADYSTSKWARKETALTEDEVAAIDQYGLGNLADALPKMPTDEELAIMVDMFHASVDGEAYDTERWGKYFKPAGYSPKNEDTTLAAPKTVATPVAKPVAKAAPAPVAEDDDSSTESNETPEKTVAAPAAGGSRAEDILAMIRNRQKTAS